MNKYAFILAVAALATPACATATTSPGTGGAGGSGGSATTSTSTGTPSKCAGILKPNACATCLEGGCCDQVAACSEGDCIACAAGDTTVCTAANQTAATALKTCVDATCDTACNTPAPAQDPTCTAPTPSPSAGTCVTLSATIACNPVTSAPCDTAAGEACDANADGYQCYPDGNTQDLCQTCSATDGFCKGGEACVGVCAKYCCDDGDCGAGKCDLSGKLAGGVGICIGGN
jgi:hypothetical protein